ncbi:MAG: InlB B-repeat-containing protein, partial [Bacteroidaceae bacterium]|nr:InlB B-repeat-containing protein [Bacteroidaceae bacterium]
NGEVTKAFVVEFQKFIDTPVTAILPETDKYYILKSGLSYTEPKAVYNDDGVAKWKTFDENDVSFYWKLVEVEGGYAFQNGFDGCYLQGSESPSGIWSVTKELGSNNLLNIEAFENTEAGAHDEYAIILAGWQMHTAGHNGGAGESGNVVSWNGTAMNTASAWLIEEATKLPDVCVIYNFTYGGNLVYRQETYLPLGSEYPEFEDFHSHWGLYYGAKPEGVVTSNVEVEVVMTETSLPFEAVTDGTPEKWYYMAMHATYMLYIQPAGDSSIEWADKTFEMNEADKHQWGFVGDLLNGFIIVNKVSGKAVKSTDSDVATMVDIADATKFIAWESLAGNECFCFKTPQGNFLSASDGMVKHSLYNDAASSFYVFDASLDFNSPKLTPAEPVSSLGCITIEFAREILVNWPETDASVINICANGEVVESVAKSDVELFMSGLSFNLENEIIQNAVVTLEFPEGFSIRSMAGEEFSGYDNLMFEVQSQYLQLVNVTPNEGETVESLNEFTLQFSEEISYITPVVLNVMKDSEVVATITANTDAVNGAEVKFTLGTEITEGGTYTVELPADFVTGCSGKTMLEAEIITFEVSYKCFDVAVTPNNTVGELNVINITFNDYVLDIASEAIFNIVDEGNNIVTTARASADGKVVTFVLDSPVTLSGVYNMTVGNDVITTVNGVCYGGKTFAFEVVKNLYSVTFMLDGVEYDKREFLQGETITLPQEPTKDGYTFIGWDNLPETMPAEDIEVTAKFNINSYIVTFMVDGKVYKVEVVEYGADIPYPTAPAKEGHEFVGWDGIPSSMPAEDIEVTAKFNINSYIIAFMVDGKVYKVEVVEYGADIPYPTAPAKEGHEFVGWDGIPLSMPAEDIEVEAKFSVNKYLVIFKLDGKTYMRITVEYGAEIKLPKEPTKEGYIFSGWSDIPETMPAKNVTITGSFTKIETGIDQVMIDSGEVVIYDLNGLRIIDVRELKSGVYIVNGKKIWVNEQNLR